MTPPKTTAPAPQRAADPSHATREEIIRVASELFYLQGYHSTGIKQIIDDAGVAKGTYYSHFQSKEELGTAWLQARHTQWNDWLDQAIAKKTTPKSKLLAAVDFVETWLNESRFRGCAFLNTASEITDPSSPMRAEVEKHKLDLRNKIHALVSAHFGKKSGQRIAQIADIIFLLIEGAIVESQNLNDSWPVQAARKETERLLAANS